MASGKTHDRLTRNTALILFPAVLVGESIRAESVGDAAIGALVGAVVASLSCLISGYFLSPDIDVIGYLKRRYGILRFIWIPYYKLCHLTPHYRVNGKPTHRSLLAHTPIIGTASRVIYLGAIAQLVGVNTMNLQPLILEYPTLFIQSVIGLEVAALVHLFADLFWSENS